MAIFYARVELHGESVNYEKLHEIMKQLGWHRTLPATNGTKYMLPTGMYRTESARDISVLEEEVWNTVRNAAISDPAPDVLVIQRESSKFHLSPIPAKALKKGA